MIVILFVERERKGFGIIVCKDFPIGLGSYFIAFSGKLLTSFFRTLGKLHYNVLQMLCCFKVIVIISVYYFYAVRE